MAAEARRRAPAMSADQRRAEIVQAVVPLLTEHGANVTTRQIAQAAGVAEGTIFRVFGDKDEVLHACVSEVFRTDVVSAQIRAVPAEGPVEEQLTEAGVLLAEHFGRLGELMHALATSGYDVHHHRMQAASNTEGGAAALMRELVDAVAHVFDRQPDRFRLPVEELARMLLGLLMSLRFAPTRPEDRRTTIAQHVDVLLRGSEK